eukprot:CAMPEP_0198270570 /NCGR_PEP_ID=MMETSP1447-20131203/45575_1 /TAXON_ID=420782 /ORGANISM="Chaetoceros dichaeta, Strain CCMP1751" /LENGTH=388 /DNA_ID=CAMNT_0043962665 /DNA_START=39 /DNA_END=1201 /DNA_ORIENTATION=+
MLRDKAMILLRGCKQTTPLIRPQSNKRLPVTSTSASYLLSERNHRVNTSPHYQHTCFYHKTSAHFNDNRDEKSIENNHKLFEEQLLELEEERTAIFGENEEAENDTNPLASSIDRNNAHSLRESDLNCEERVDNMNMDRESLYDFTQEEKESWVNVAEKSKTYDASFLEAVEKARKSRHLLKSGDDQNSDMSLEKDEKYSMDDVPQNRTGHKDITQLNNSLHFTHLNPTGDKIAMVDVGMKEVTRRVATARSVVVFPPEVMEAFGLKDWEEKSKESSYKEEVIGPKGPIFATAQLAGIMGAKRTSDLIPLCHPLTLDKVHVDIKLVGNRAIVECESIVTHKTGVEMEALVGASIAALTIYDMVKAISHSVRIEGTELVSKTGGKSDIG